ncbi:LysO family transporter [uncultured Alistipes sp.]|uniref:LysO family transporter n=1 Tax=uncultured Alistipes sp. TaxID=538949 RepID=UPI0025DA15D6|nr:LysO family transporter [uncultured Alistipes sp.]
MFTIILFLMSGIGIGYLLRGRRVVALAGRSIRFVVLALVFVIGFSTGSHGELLSQFGRQAVVIAALGIAGSLVAAWLAARLLFGKGGAR